jgi:peptidyl-prolyl cis-trans isomerase B (cyclophilin B)
MPRRTVPLVALALAGALLPAACGGGDEGGNRNPASATRTPSGTGGRTDTGCRKVPSPAPKQGLRLPKPKLELSPSRSYVATVSTSCGDFRIALDSRRAPRTTGSFAYLARKGFYDRTTFHRISPGFVIQGGDPLGNGRGGPGYSVVEPPPKDLRYTRGVVAMAKTQFEPAGTSGSQFFVVTADDAKLPPEYALLGRVSEGKAVVDRIAAADIDQLTEAPVDPIVIDSITIARR